MRDFFEEAGSFIAFGVVVAMVFSMIMAYPVMLLWNWLVPMILGLPALGFWEAWGVLVLCNLLIKSSSSSSSS